MHIARDTEIVALVEGESDRQALLVLAGRLGRDLAADHVEVVAMGGATNIDHYVARFGPTGLGLEIVGLCDVAEEAHFARVLDRDAFQVCDEDLEDELIRALGVDEMIEFIESEGESKMFRIFQKQPAQRERSIENHLHRFCGTLSGRKIRYAAGMANRLPIDCHPEPLVRLLSSI